MSSWLSFVTRLSLSLSISGKQTLGRICYIPMLLSSLLSHEPGDRLRLCKHNSWIIKTLFIHSLWSNGCCRFSSYILWDVVEILKGQFSWTSQWLISWVFPVKLTLLAECHRISYWYVGNVWRNRLPWRGWRPWNIYLSCFNSWTNVKI